ncbi:MAG: CPBP family intramembrane glutamic endopeptidase, partial [Thermodesulfobacteriota bacterium]
MPSSDELKARPHERLWGFWVTLGLSAIVFALFSALPLLIMIAVLFLAKVSHHELDLELHTKSLFSSGFFLAITEIVSGLICTPLLLLFARLRQNILVKDYIGFRKPSKREWAKWLLILAAFLFLSDVVSLLLHQPIVPPFMADAYKTAFFLPALFFAILVVAPIFEEILFRGFLFQGIRYSRLGPMGAIGITSFFWAIIHLQY